MRAAWVILVCACGGTTTPSGPHNVQRGGGGEPPKSASIESCEPSSSGHKPGNHDRYMFEDPATGKYGFKNKAGTVVLPAIYPSVYEFSPFGVAGVVVEGTGGPFQFIDPTGKTLARAYAFDNGPDYFQEGYARIIDDAKRVGYIDERGRVVIAPRYLSAAPFCRGKAEVEIDGGTHYIDKQGNKTTPPAPDKDPHALDAGPSGA
jgi:hypothetical protein